MGPPRVNIRPSMNVGGGLKNLKKYMIPHVDIVNYSSTIVS